VANDDIYQVLFGDLGLDVLRLGNWYQNQTETGTSTSTPFSDTPATIVVQKATAALGHPPRILMSSWTPPAYLKSNGDTKNGGTLVQTPVGYDYAGFGQWWVSTVSAYAERGVAVDFVSIQNEPELVTPYESCQLDAAEGLRAGYPQALDAVAAAVVASTLDPKPKLIGPESLGVGVLGFYFPGVHPNDVAGIAHHLYSSGAPGDDPPADSFIGAMTSAAQMAMAIDKPLFMTEFSPNTPSMLNTAWLIHNAVTVEGVSAYLYWALAWAPGAPVNWLVTVEDPSRAFTTAKGYTINDPYYALKHYARWVDEGWVRVDAASSLPAVKSSAFVSPDGLQLTVVLLNTDAAAHTVAVAPGGFAATTAAAYRSAGAAERTTPVTVDAAPTVDMPAQSIVTVTLR
jgi:glucuronoarabinoxylan endo-1,4-beta-xylanase